jgi:hypothetical protein
MLQHPRSRVMPWDIDSRHDARAHHHWWFIAVLIMAGLLLIGVRATGGFLLER